MKRNTLLIGCIADDFTGGSDAASFLRKAGLKTVLLNGVGDWEGVKALRPEAVVIALKSRSIPAELAVSRTLKAAKWLLECGAAHLYFKYCSTFDSTPKGNIGPVTDALMELTESKYTVVCPSLPINGRTVKDGILYVNGTPLAESHMRNHPINPMTRSDISVLMAAQSRYPCFILQGNQMERIQEELAGEQRFTMVPSYSTDADGARIAEKFGHLPLLTGGSGLLEHLGRLYGSNQCEAREPSAGQAAPKGLPRLLLAGSCSAMTRKQVETYLAQGGNAIRIEPDKLLSGMQTEKELRQAIRLADGDILLYSTADSKRVRAYQRMGSERVSALLEALMGRLAVYGRDCGYQRIVVAGGETSGAVIRELKTGAFQIGADVAPGVPELWPINQPELALVLKSGNFGDETFFLHVLAN